MAKPKRRAAEKIAEGLQEALAAVRAENEQKSSPFDEAKSRLLAALTEVNAALEQCHKCVDMRVFLSMTKSEMEPARLRPQIYRLDYSEITFAVKLKHPEWQLVKDPSFQDVAGRGVRY